MADNSPLSYQQIMTINQSAPCPCGKQENSKPLPYLTCCGKLHQGEHKAQTPEALMRSRYSAFVYQDYDYLILTHHPSYLNGMTASDLSQGGEPDWLSLQIISSSMTSPAGQVEFQAWYRTEDGIDAIHERSEFIFVDGSWLYTQGEQFEADLPKRNQVCVCGSGKKFKQCCSR